MEGLKDLPLTPLPIDRVAARVTGVGEHYEPKSHSGSAILQLTLIAPPPFIAEHQLSNTIGQRVGSLVCLGLFKRREASGKPGGRKNLWVMRCDCGAYTLRTHRMILNKSFGETESCGYCRDVRLARQHGS